MRHPSFTTQLKRDLKLMLRRGHDEEKFKEAARKLIQGVALEAPYRHHKLQGSFKGRWECHLAPDWLLVYKLEGDCIIFERMGTHADLFE
jgi:mRNA interferase YafQ